MFKNIEEPMRKLAIPATRVAFLALTALKPKNIQNLCKLTSNGQENTTKLQKIQNLPIRPLY